MSSDRNLLFGILAVQMDFISRDALIQAMHAWLLNKQTPLGDILQQQKSLTSERAQLLEALVQEHLKSHDNDPQKSLAALSSVESLKDALLHLPDTQLQQSLLALAEHTTPYQQGMKAESHGYDPSSGATRSYIAADSSSRFRILRPHAKGGLGEVFVAEDTELHREVALKEIQDKHSHNENSRGRFILEAEVTGGLEHPNIVPVYGLGTYADGRPYYAMRFIRGDSLKEAIERFYKTTFPNASERNLAFRSLLKQFIDVCNAIAYAHSRGILHRDLKPGNIMLGKYGETLVVDWGLAKAMGKSNRASEGTDEYGERTLNPSGSSYAETMAGSAIGTPAFMSPEQAAGRLDQLGPPSDVYSLGATLYVILTGELPFTDKGYEILKKVEDGNFPPPRQVRPETPDVLNAIVLKAMAKEMEHRYPTATALAEEIEHYLADEPVTAYREPILERTKRWARKHPGIVAGLTATLLVGVMGLVIGSIMLSGKNDELATTNQALGVAVDRAKQNEELAYRNERLAGAKATEANSQKLMAQRLLGFSRVDRGLLDWQNGLTTRALLWFAEQGVVNPNQVETNDVVRHRIASFWRYLQMPKLQQIIAHQARVSHIAISSDGNHFITTDGKARVWNLTTGQPITQPMVSQMGIRHAVFSPDGRHCVTSGWTEAQVWDTLSGKPVSQPLKHKSFIKHAAFSKNGQFVVTASDDKTAQIWDASSGNPMSPPLVHYAQVQYASFSPDGLRVVTASRDKTVRIWNTVTGQQIQSLLGHEGGVKIATYSPDGDLVLSASDDNTVRIWNCKTGKLHIPPILHQKEISNASFSADGSLIVTSSWDHTARVWDVKTGKPVSPPLEHQDAVLSSEFSPDGRRVITASKDKSARVWNAASGYPLTPPIVHQFEVNHATFCKDGHRFLTACGDLETTGAAYVWDMVGNKSDDLPFSQQSDISHVVVSNNGRLIGTVSKDKAVRVWDVASRKPITPKIAHQKDVRQISFSPDATMVLTVCGDYGPNGDEVHVWNSGSGKLVVPPILVKGMVTDAIFSPDSRRIVTASMNNVQAWDVSSGLAVCPPIQHQVIVTHGAFSRDSRYLLTTTGQAAYRGQFLSARAAISGKPGAQVWDIETGKALSLLMTNDSDDGMCFAEFSPDEQWIITTSIDKTARVWNVKTGQPVSPLLVHQDQIVKASFSSDGRRVITASRDKTARVWDAVTGKPLSPPLVHQSSVNDARFNPTGHLVVTASEDKTVRVWDAVMSESAAMMSGQPVTPPLMHDHPVLQAFFNTDGNVQTSGKDPRIWKISPDKRPWPDLLQFVQVISWAKLDSLGGITRLDLAKELVPWFQQLKSKYPSDFCVTPQQARAWRENEIAQCMKEGNLSAAFFHRDWLIAEMVQQAAAAKSK